MSKSGSIWPWLIGGAAVVGGVAWAVNASAKPSPTPTPEQSRVPMTPQFLAGLRDEFRRKVVEPQKVNWDPNKNLTTYQNAVGWDYIRHDYSMLSVADANKLAAQTPTEIRGIQVIVVMPQAK